MARIMSDRSDCEGCEMRAESAKTGISGDPVIEFRKNGKAASSRDCCGAIRLNTNA